MLLLLYRRRAARPAATPRAPAPLASLSAALTVTMLAVVEGPTGVLVGAEVISVVPGRMVVGGGVVTITVVLLA